MWKLVLTQFEWLFFLTYLCLTGGPNWPFRCSWHSLRKLSFSWHFFLSHGGPNWPLRWPCLDLAQTHLVSLCLVQSHRFAQSCAESGGPSRLSFCFSWLIWTTEMTKNVYLVICLIRHIHHQTSLRSMETSQRLNLGSTGFTQSNQGYNCLLKIILHFELWCRTNHKIISSAKINHRKIFPQTQFWSCAYQVAFCCKCFIESVPIQ